MAKRKAEAAPDSDASVQETEGVMSEQAQATKQQPNIKLRDGAKPVTEGDLGYRDITLPKADAQEAGWYEPQAQIVISLYGTHYELLNGRG
jgi:hypothetical protein